MLATDMRTKDGWRVMPVIRVAICDDDILSLELLYELVQAYLSKQPQSEFLIRRFHSPYDLLECVENPNLQFHIYFLDVVMPIFSGIEVGRIIRKSDDFAAIIYTTSSSDHALEAISTEALQYLVKPIEPDALHAALDTALRRLEQSAGKNVLIKRKDGLTNIAMHQIEYVEYRDHALSFALRDGEMVPSRTIQQSFGWVADNVLNDPRFLKPHSSFIVNMDYVATLNAKEFVMASGTLIPISKRVYAAVRQQYIDYMVDKRGANVL